MKKKKLNPSPNTVIKNIEDFLEKNHIIIFAFIIAVSLILAIKNRFIQDDAYISFIYSRNLIEGKGLTWFGTYVEGYTNFLWVLIIAGGMYLKFEPVIFSHLTGIILFSLLIYIVWLISFLIFKRFLPAFITTLLLITNYSMTAYATGGLETILQTLLIALSFYFYYRNSENKRTDKGLNYILVSFFLSLAILTRLDSALPAAVILVFCLYNIFKAKKGIKYYIFLLLPLIVIISIYFIWKTDYYGRILPNSYYAKVGYEPGFNINGLKFIFRFFHWYMLWPFFVTGIFYFLQKKLLIQKNLNPIIIYCTFWIIYIIYVGGDFMEFRFFIPVLPFLFILITYIIYTVAVFIIKRREIIILSFSVLFIIFFSYYHSVTFKEITDDNCLDSIDFLSNFYGLYPDNNWNLIGDKLKYYFKDTDITLGLGPVGAIVYYSNIKTIDMIGLNELNIQGNYIPKPENYKRPGHRLISTLKFLQSQNVNFVIAHPTPIPLNAFRSSSSDKYLKEWFNSFFKEKEIPIKEATFTAIPVTNNWNLLVLYLVKNAEIDKIIGNNNFEIKTVSLIK